MFAFSPSVDLQVKANSAANPQEVVLADVQVMYVESATGPEGASEAFDRVETRLPSLKGRKF